MDLLVGVDLGTTACKVTVVASDLTASSISSSPYPIAAPHREWAEQDPRAWERLWIRPCSVRWTPWVRVHVIM